jgi:hypothetical protein
MSNPWQTYVESWGGRPVDVQWSPAALPSEVAQIPGFEFGPTLDGQLRATDFVDQTLGVIWGVLPAEFRNSLLIGVQDLIGSATSTIGQSANSILSGAFDQLPAMLGIAGAAQKTAEWIVQWIEDMREDNDERRYEARLELVEWLENAGPGFWTGDNFGNPRYTRKIALKRNKSNPAWPSDRGHWFGLHPNGTRRKGDCKDGGSDLAPRGEDCVGSISLYPIFMPIWSDRAFGTPGPMVTMRKGMERAYRGGSLIWEKMFEMQAALLTDPIVNLYADGEWLWNHFIRFKDKVNAAMWATLTIDREFDPNYNGVPDRFFKTPGGMIAAYDGVVTGYLNAPSLDALIIDGMGYSSFGGTGITVRQFNSVLTAVAQFFALRAATLRTPGLMQYVGNDQELMVRIPEGNLRAAIAWLGDGNKPPPREAMGPPPRVPDDDSGGVGGGSGGLTFVGVEKKPSTGGGGGAIIAGAAAIGFAALLAKR